MRRFLIAILFAFAVTARALTAQATLVINEGALAVTACWTYDSNVVSYIDVTMLGTDSAAEILSHEAVHVRQAKEGLAATGKCPEDTPRASLAREVEAYCVSDSLRLERIGPDTERVSSETLERLYAQFYGVLKLQDDQRAWFRGCPRYARVPKAGAP